MCLSTVDEKPMRKFGVGYKLVEKREDGTYVCYDHIDHAGKVTYPLNQWLTDPNDGEADGCCSDAKYRTGFHISLDLKSLKCIGHYGDPYFPIIKVRFRKVTATSCTFPGQSYGRQVVAREIMNLGEVE